ncbi:MAG: hypothetical protein PHY15_01870 [Eubacteriales bacterium]|nr:hypothetical protein [Eubacteriales bacterium]MDD4474825.1 hypothetical protein [Eubacteriales bacterium]
MLKNKTFSFFVLIAIVILFSIVLIFFLASKKPLPDNPESEPDNATSSVIEESAKESIPEESLEESIPEESLVSDVSEELSDRIVLSEVDGSFYINFKDGNDVEIIYPNFPVAASPEYKSFDEFKTKLKKLDFNKDEIYTIKASFEKSKNGILFINPDKIYYPKCLSDEFSFRNISLGSGWYSFRYLSNDQKLIDIFYSDKNETHFESLEEKIKRVTSSKPKKTKTTEEFEGYQKIVYSFTSETGIKFVHKFWTYKINETEYVVEEQYVSPSPSSEPDFNEGSFYVSVDNIDYNIYIYSKVHVDPEFLSGLILDQQ